MLEDEISRALEDDECIQNTAYEGEMCTGLDVSGVEFASVSFSKCRFSKCNFTKARFYSSSFKGCAFDSCNFEGSYWGNTEIVDCNGNSGNFCNAWFEKSALLYGSFCYANYSYTVWHNCIVTDSVLKGAIFSYSKLEKVEMKSVNFNNAEFFKTPLDGIDLSECEINNITLSDTFEELKGVKVNSIQAVGIAGLLGIKVV